MGAGYRLTDTTRLRAAAGSGVKNPGFFELFGFVDGRFIGNDALRPEKSTGWEAGVDQDLGTSARLSVTYFDSELEGEIFTTFPPPNFIATPANRTTVSDQRGVEVALSARFAEQCGRDALIGADGASGTSRATAFNGPSISNSSQIVTILYANGR